ncbi:Hemolysin, contains CBS domains [Sulfobacillus thermosulfidooxidans DSM 9293]|uniref:Hemolysin, contains CBS domains n=1 Tax=Sulfobacillus thermosulfidooxidans (strain DSM 9293 / VKM B-1269 / AT-1) TaxID=929705 RepID=A0A1W1W8L8_SULTA|nr:hemolysin family protein [Sulfobacillus thermosulfidooxidans]SMC02489.1 Hemolysin, contains CBS domains [Sulfobacillus thermosulfidooxidans DSM 9293]
MRAIRWGPIVVLIVLVGLSAMYSMTETAMMSLSRGKVRNLVEEGHKQGRWLERLVEQPNRLLGTVLFGNNLTNIMASTIATGVFIYYFGSNGIAIATVVMTLFILLVAEIIPKTYAAHNSERVALRFAFFLEASARIFYPVVRVLTWFGVGIIRLFGARAQGGRLLTEEEIRSMVEVGEEEGLLEADERQMIQGIFDLGETVAREVMVPRIDVNALPDTAPLREAWDAVIHWGHSRLPVFRKTIDDVVGVIYARDILAYLKERDPQTPIGELARPVLYIPETKKVDELLADFRRQRTQIAVVLDEYGGTAGIVTIEDLLEEIVGEIQDEYDQEDQPIRQLDDGVIDVAGMVQLEEVNDILDVDLPHEDFDTVGGLILHLLGRAPVEGEIVRWDNLEFTVSKVVGRRVARVIIKAQKPEQTTDEDD